MRYLVFAALLAIAGGHASSQPADCPSASPAACAGDQTCIQEARQLRQQCLNANANANGVANANANGIGAPQTVTVPEPGTLVLMGLGAGLLGLALTLRKKAPRTQDEQQDEHVPPGSSRPT